MLQAGGSTMCQGFITSVQNGEPLARFLGPAGAQLRKQLSPPSVRVHADFRHALFGPALRAGILPASEGVVMQSQDV